MKLSRLFSHTLREIPSDAEVTSHQLLLRAGYIRQLSSGVFSYLHLGRRTLDKVERIMRQEIDHIGGQEIHMPIVQPADLWRESGRWQLIDAELGRLQDRSGRDLVLGMTHEEVVADLVRKEVRSYRQLPQLIYHIQPKWRDDPRPRAGLIRAREFTMKDSYSLDADWEGLDVQYRAHYQAYYNIFRRCGLDVITVAGDVGIMGGAMAHEFMYLTPIGEDTLILCSSCGHSANRQVATFKKSVSPTEQPAPLEPVATPDCKSIESLAAFLGVQKSKTAKAVFMVATVLSDDGASASTEEKFVFAIVRGDMEVNETKLASAVTAQALRPATEEEIRKTGAEPGYASPVGLAEKDRSWLIVVDDMIPVSANLIAGANKTGYHLRNVNFGRDFRADIVVDIAAAQDGDACPNCGSPMSSTRGVEVGNIFKLGSRFSDTMSCTYSDRGGQEKPVIMGSYGIGTGRLMACVVEAHHDADGICWPISIAPYQVHLVLLQGKGGNQEIVRCAENIFQELAAAGIEVLYDDRLESPGVKFKDADLIGIPLRITVGERGYQQGGVEYKHRSQPEKLIIPFESLMEKVREDISTLHAEISARLRPVEFKE